MDGVGHRNLRRTAMLGGVVVMAVVVITVGFFLPGKAATPGTPGEDEGGVTPEETLPPVAVEAPAPSLHRLAGAGDLVGMERLLAAGADVDAPAGEDDAALAGMTPLMVAARNGAGTAAVMLLSAGADPNVPGAGGQTALLIAAEEENRELVGQLLEAGADARVASDSGRTALMAAAGSEDPMLVVMLLNAGADPMVTDASGRSAMAIAGGRRDEAGLQIAAMLREASGD